MACLGSSTALPFFVLSPTGRKRDAHRAPRERPHYPQPVRRSFTPRVLTLRATAASTSQRSLSSDWAYAATQLALAFPPTAWALKRLGRSMVIRRAEQLGIPWRRNYWLMQMQRYELEQRRARLVNRDLVYPRYYLDAQFHTYTDGNLGWMPALEVESSALSVHARLFPDAPPLEGDRRLRDTFLDRLLPYLRSVLADGPEPYRVLDMGCSTGRSTFHLIDRLLQSELVRPLEVTGLDLSPFMLAVAEWYATHRGYDEGVRMLWKHGAAEDVPEPSNAFNLVTCSLVTHELPQTATGKLIREAHRVLRPGGMLGMMDSDPHSDGFRSLPAPALAIFRSTEPYFAEYEKVDVARELQDTGFELCLTENNTTRHRTWIARKTQ